MEALMTLKIWKFIIGLVTWRFLISSIKDAQRNTQIQLQLWHNSFQLLRLQVVMLQDK